MFKRIRRARIAAVICFFATYTLSLLHFQSSINVPTDKWIFHAHLGQPTPSAFIYTKELPATQQSSSMNATAKIVMKSEVYGNLTNRIRRIKHEGKPLLIMVNSHPCAGKSTFLWQGEGKPGQRYFMGCKLIDFDWLPGGLRDSSYLMQDTVTNNTALFGDSVRSAEGERYDDIIYIWVVPPLATIKQFVEQRQAVNGKHKWSRLHIVIERRQRSLMQTIKDEVLVEPLFPTFQEGMEFCINTFNIDTRVDNPEEPPNSGIIVKIK